MKKRDEGWRWAVSRLFKKRMIGFVIATAVTFSTTSLIAVDGCFCDDYYENGCGYEETCCAPNYAMIGAGLLAVAAIVIAVIALVDDGDTNTAHSH